MYKVGYRSEMGQANDLGYWSEMEMGQAYEVGDRSETDIDRPGVIGVNFGEVDAEHMVEFSDIEGRGDEGSENKM